jgi:RNA polymerase sigma-70 factor, ECF subfamily
MSASPDLTDEQVAPDLVGLVARIRGGDAQAEAEVLSRFAFGVRVILRRHARGAAIDVDDLAQDVLTAVLEQLRKGGLREAAALPAYIRTSAMHRLHAEQRASQATQRSHERVEAEDPRLVASDRGPADELDAARKSRQIRELLAEMPVARDREVLTRFYLQEQDCAQICAELEIDPEHFRRVIHRARSRFREILNRAGLGPDKE